MRTAFLCLLAAASSAAAGERAHITREVPHHDVSLLSDCTVEEASDIHHELAVAISLGAPTYNAGDFEGCYRTYSNAAVAIDARQKSCSGVRRALMAGVERARRLRTFDEKAWAMRDAFDGVLDVIERGETGRAPALPEVERHVPKYPTRMVDDCAPANRARVIQAIADAIEVGAPIYNEGKLDACARVYMGTAMELQGGVTGCVQVKRALETAVTQSRAQKDPATRAWMMRDVFDGLLDVLARKPKVNADEI